MKSYVTAWDGAPLPGGVGSPCLPGSLSSLHCVSGQICLWGQHQPDKPRLPKADTRKLPFLALLHLGCRRDSCVWATARLWRYMRELRCRHSRGVGRGGGRTQIQVYWILQLEFFPGVWPSVWKRCVALKKEGTHNLRSSASVTR